MVAAIDNRLFTRCAGGIFLFQVRTEHRVASGFPVGLLEMQDFCPALHPESESESWRGILGWWARGEGGQLRGLEVGHLTPLPDEAP